MYRLCWTLAIVFTAALTTHAGEPKLELKPKDHICIIGNTLADRMQHDAWLDAYLHSRFPAHDLTLRNLGYSGDELTKRMRSMAFGTPDEWLSGSAPVPQPKRLNPNAPVLKNRFERTNTKADVIFGFFGYNESFAGEQGLAKFKSDLGEFIKHTKSQKYNGTSPPRLVLFSPIAFENRNSPHLPDGKATNRRLEMYTAAMAEVAKAQGVPFVDLFHPSLDLYAKNERPLTINGVHLNEFGNEQIAKVIDDALFGKAAEGRTTERLEKIRQAAKDRNFAWFTRYRKVDGYSTFGDRAFLRFVGGQTNYEVVQRELEQLDVMTQNRDKRVWAIAKGGDLKIDDSNTPAEIPVTSNKKGPLEGGKHLFLSGEEAIKKMTLGKGLKIQLFASEKEFPDLINPVQMSFDPQGRLWVATWPTYPHGKPKQPQNDTLMILEDTDGDGKADKKTIFAGDLHCPTGFEFWNGGVLVAQAPDLVFLKDTDGDGKYDVKQRVIHGLDSADTHHTSNSFVLDPGGALYFQEGTFHQTQVETPYGGAVRNSNAGVFRYEPRAQKFEVYVNYGFANPHGHVFDRWGVDIVVDGTGANPFHGALFSGQTEPGQRHGRPPQVYKQKTRPCPGMEILSSQHFPGSMDGNLLVPNVIGFLGIMQYKVKENGASITATEVEPIVSSSDPNFRPSDLRTGPDGAIWFIDWHNPIIGHMQHNLRDPNRDKAHGRIYRITAEGRPLSKSPPIAGAPLDQLLNNLKHPEDRVRYRTRIELTARPTNEVLAAVSKWTASLDPKDADVEHHMMEALWLHQSHDIVNEALLRRVLRSPDFRARAAATRVLCYWRDRVREPLALLRKQINDVHPRVRLEAIRALSFFHGEPALAVALELLTHPTDEYLNFVFNETLSTLERRVGGGKLNRGNIAASLVSMLAKTEAPERKATLLETIVRHGSPKELQVVWNLVVKDELTPRLRDKVLDWLADAALTRKAQPSVDAGALRGVLQKVKSDEQADVIRLARAWKAKELAGDLRDLAASTKADLQARYAALDALASFGDAESIKTLAGLAGPGAGADIRFRAAAGLSRVDVKTGAEAAAKALADAKESDDPSVLVEAFLIRKNGSDELASALGSRKLSVDTAKQVLRAMYLAGRNDPKLNAIVSKYAGFEAAPKPPTPDEVRKLQEEVLAKGDAVRGEHIFRRADLGCIKCHAIHKAGGNIGPDLGPVGGTSPLDYIIASILDPNAAVKEEYLTSTVITGTGLAVNGIVIEKTRDHITLKDATGKKIKIAKDDIDEVIKGKTLMPEGVTRILTRGELLDLIRFVGDLGKPGPYGMPTTTTVQRWKRLKAVNSALNEGVPNRDLVRDHLLNTTADSWETVYSLVGGKLPLSELHKSGAKSQVIYLQSEVQVNAPGKIEFDVTGPAGTTFWVGEEAYEKTGKATLDLAAGVHRITVRVVAAEGNASDIRVELRKPADSKVHFEMVHAGE